MKKRLKKIMAGLMVIILAFGLVDVPGMPSYHSNVKADNPDFEIDEDGILVEYKGEGGDIVIPDGVVEIRDGAFWNYNQTYNIKSVTFPDSLEIIGDDAFAYCNQMTIDSFPDSLVSIGDRAFYDCDGITSVVLPQNIALGECAFSMCDSITQVSMPIGSSMKQSTFGGCENLQSFSYPQDAEVVDAAVCGCPKLINVVLPENAVKIDVGAFSGCESLEEINIPDSVTEIGAYAFSGCKSLESIVIPEGVSEIGRETFAGCISLISISLPNNMGGSISEQTFYNCKSLTGFTIPDNVYEIHPRAFEECNSIEAFHVSSSAQHFKTIDGVLFSKNGNKLVQFPAAKSKEYTVPSGTVTISDRAFAGNTMIEKIILPEDVEVIGESAFEGCTTLSELLIMNSEATLGTDALKGCTSLKSYTKGEEVISMDDYDFDIDENGVLLSYRGEEEIVTIPNSVKTIGKSAFEHKSCKKIIIPETVTVIRDSAFSYCENLSEINLPNSLEELGERVFASCTSLPESMFFPQNLKKMGGRITDYSYVKEYTFLSDDVEMPIDVVLNESIVNNRYDIDGIVIYGNRNSTSEKMAKRMGYTFKTLDGSETIEYGDVKECFEVSSALVDAYFDFLTEYYIDKYPQMAFERYRCSEKEHIFFKKLAIMIQLENPDKSAPLAFYDWMNDNIEIGVQYGYPIDVYNYKTADCLGNAYLLCELLRCANIPAVVAEGYVGNMKTNINERMILDGGLVRHAWVLYYYEGKWQSLDSAMDYRFSQKEDIATWYYINAVDNITIKTPYFTTFIYDLWDRVIEENKYVSPGGHIGDKIGGNMTEIMPEGVFIEWDNDKNCDWLDADDVVMGTIGEKGWYGYGSSDKFYKYVTANGHTLCVGDTLEREGKLYWFGQNGYAFDITGHDGKYFRGYPVFEVGDEVEVKVFGTIDERNYYRYENDNDTVAELQNDGKVKIKKIGADSISVYHNSYLYGENSLSTSLGFYVVNSKPYQNIGLTATAGTNKVILSWNEIPNATRYVVKEYVNGVWIDRKMINQNVSFTEMDGLVNGQEYTFAIDVYAPMKKGMIEYRFEPEDQVTVTPEDMCAKAQGELGQELAAGNSASDKVDSIQENLSMDSVAMVMHEDEESLEQIRQLDNQYADEKGIASGVEVSDDTKDIIAQDKVGMIGGAMNVENGDATLDISRPEDEKVIDENRYANNVQLDIKLMNGGREHRDLRMPVSITIPIPTGLLLGKLVILHYLPDGRPETVDWHDNGNGTVSFVVKHFSTFVMANEEGLDIDETHFPDGKFREYVSEHFDNDHNGKLSQEEVDAVTVISCAGTESERYGISSLEGVEYFTNLKELDCSWNSISQLDISKNVLLERLRCFGNYIDSLELSKNVALISLNCSNNNLLELDLSNNTEMRALLCEGNVFSEIDISSCPELEKAYKNGEKTDPADDIGESGIAWLYRKDGSTLQVGSDMQVTVNNILDVSFKHTISLNNDLSIAYAIPEETLAGYENIKLIIQKQRFNADGSEVTLVDDAVNSYSTETLPNLGDCLVFRYKGIAAKEMGNKVYAVLSAEKDGVVYESVVDEYSILTYASNKLNQSGTSEKLRNLLIDLLNYGAAAQVYFEYNTGNLVNKNLSEEQKARANGVDINSITSDFESVTIDNPKAEFTAKTLNLGNNIAIAYLMGFDSTVSLENVKLKITYANISGGIITKTVPFSEFQTTSTENVYRFDFVELAAKNLWQPINVVLYENEEQISGTMTYSIPTYVYNMISNNKMTEKLEKIIKPLMAYCESAKCYFNN